MNFLADSARTSLELPYTTLAQRRLAEQIVADDQTLQCERCDFGQERWLHIFKQRSRGHWRGNRPPGMPPMMPAYSRTILPTPKRQKTDSASIGAEQKKRINAGGAFEQEVAEITKHTFAMLKLNIEIEFGNRILKLHVEIEC